MSAVAQTTPPLYAIPRAAWRRPLGLPYPDAGRPRVDDPMIDDGPWGALPLGGIGAGGIGRTHAGDFRRWHVRTGVHHVESRPRCGFGLYVEERGERRAWALASEGVPLPRGWGSPLPVGAGSYAALFPRAWFRYEPPATPLRIEQLQYSPVLPHEYEVSSWPVAVFEFRFRNDGDVPLVVALLAAWDDLVGFPWDSRPSGTATRAIRTAGHAGLEFGARPEPVSCAADGTWALLVDRPGASLAVPVPADESPRLWADFAADGALDERARPAPRDGEDAFGALAVREILPPGGETRVRLALAWDLPLVESGAGTRWYRRHTRSFGASGRNAARIAQAALDRDAAWRAALDAWQEALLRDPDAPGDYVAALLNELYVLVDGGTLWVDPGADAPARDGVGRFAFLECYDYPFYNTYDVLFYASWALLRLWPELERGVMRDLLALVPLADDARVEIETTGRLATRKVAGAVPHDAGTASEDPFLRANAYRFRDVNGWKDLNAKFVLQLWRDRIRLDDPTLVHDGWPAVVAALERLAAFDRDGDGLPEHDGLPDQTFDTWPMHGPSAYGGGLWLAALAAAAAMAAEVGDAAAARRYSDAWSRGCDAYAALWNGRCFDFDGHGPSRDSVMADQLCGIWYADACGLPAHAAPERVRSALETIYRMNVAAFADGRMGAVNGVRPDGSVDASAEQSGEVWPGVTYALAATMLGRGLEREAWATALGAVRVTYERGFWFRTPEAWDADGNFRASMYMRPLSIWAIEEARERCSPTVGSRSARAG